MTAVCIRLFRLRLVLMNGIASIAGYLLFPGRPQVSRIALLFAGVSLLACAGSALNQVLERDLDAVMQRTKNRPLPRGDLTPLQAALAAAVCLLAGVVLLMVAAGPLPALLGLAALSWYLAVYTPLKRRTSFALTLGALSGAAAPVIGWCVAGGSPGDFRVVLLAGILYLWQIPHFWLLQSRHLDDYRRAGMALFAPQAKGSGPAPLFLLWVVAMIAAALMLPAFGMIGGHVAPWCAAFCAPLIVTCFRCLEPALFACLNLFPLLVTLALCAGR